MLRLLLWRLLGVLAFVLSLATVGWLLSGGPGRLLRGDSPRAPSLSARAVAGAALKLPHQLWDWAPAGAWHPARALSALSLGLGCALLGVRWMARRRRRYVRLQVEGHRTDEAAAEALVAMYEALHKRLLRRWWRRLLEGQPGLALEVHHEPAAGEHGQAGRAWLALSCPVGLEGMAQAALRTAYPNCRLQGLAPPARVGRRVVLRMKKDAPYIRRVKALDRFEHAREPAMNRLLTVMAACGSAFVQLSITPAPVCFERLARRRFKRHEQELSRERRAHLTLRDRSLVEDAELRGGLDLQDRPLFFAEIRVVAGDRTACERIASELRVGTAENRLVERGTALRQGVLGLYERRIERGEGNPVPGVRRGVYGAGELAPLWHMPSIDYLTVPFARTATPLAPAPPAIVRPGEGGGTLRDAIGPVCIEVGLRKQNTAVPGAVEQGKTSYLVATVAEDLRRERCAVIVLDPKGDAADATVSLVAPDRVCTLLDLAHPTCGFNPLAVDAPPDVIADYVVAALKNLYSEGEIKASSDRFLRNAIIAAIGHDRAATLWDVARLLSVGEEGYAYRRAVAAGVRTRPELSEIAMFFTSELGAQLADARSMTTAKLDAPLNKLARLLNSASIKRVLLNDSLQIDLDRVIAGGEVLVVKGALGLMGTGNTSVLMQLLVGMLDAALARQQDLVPEERRVAVALKVDEAPLVLNRGFAETMALKRSAGLETVACWQADAQWTDPEVRDQLDALFAHRVYFATASARDARDAVGLTMADYTDTVRPGLGHLSKLARPDARMYLPKHHAIASWCTREGRQPPFIAQTLPLEVDRDRLRRHAARQRARGGRPQTDLRQPHWQRRRERGQAAQSSPGGQAPVDRRMLDPAPAPHPAQREPGGSALPDVACESYRELTELDRAQSVRWARPPTSPARSEPDALDLEMLDLIARLGHVLSSQLHRRFHPGRAMTTTQRRLKRLSDAGWVERFQFHRRDGGGVPMCYVASPAGRALLGGRTPAPREDGADLARCAGPDSRPARQDRERRLRRARREVHVAGWVLALLDRAAEERWVVRGREESALSPRRGAARDGAPLTLSELRLPGGRVPHDFLCTDGNGREIEVERFETIRPDATVELARRKVEVMIELEDRLDTRCLQRYDHFLTGWSTHLPRFGSGGRSSPLLVFVCRDRARARRCAQLADAALLACRAHPGDYPRDWDFTGRARILFASERDLHEGLDRAYRVPPLPPAVRVAIDDAGPAAGKPTAEQCRLPL